jgi:hypothetical protein
MNKIVLILMAFLLVPMTIISQIREIKLDEVIITPKNNPALRIIRQIIDNKDINNFEQYDEFSYRCYLKSLLETKFENKRKNANGKNSVAYVTETVSLVSKQGNRDEEKIIANRTSGMKSPIFGQLMYSAFYKTISFYNASLPVFGNNQSTNRMASEYVSPLCNACISIYNFQLENEYIQEKQTDTIFEISYFPKKNQNINGLKGTMFISSDNYALTEITAQPHQKAFLDFRFRQIYQKINGKWFPTDLEETIDFGQTIAGVQIVFNLNSKITDIQYVVNEKLPNRLEKILLDEDSISENANRFDNIRPVPLTKKESACYKETDSLVSNIGKGKNIFDFMFGLFEKAPQNKIGIGKFDFDLGRIISKNEYENTRLGIGIYTNENWLKRLSIGGYVGYGTKDKAWKYGVSGEWTLQKSHDLRLTYLYQNTLKETGKNLAGNSQEWKDNYWRNIVAFKFERAIEHKVKFTYHPFRPLQLQAAFSTKNISPLFDYVFQGNLLKNYASDDLYLSVRYSFNEKFGTLGKERMLLSKGNPVVALNYTRGINWLRDKSFIYNKWETSIDLIAYNGRVGQSDLHLAGGIVDKTLPYGLMFTGEGSRGDFVSVSVKNAFQTMHPYEFLSDRYLHLFYTHDFGSLLFRTKSRRPELKIAYNAAWGILHESAAYGTDFKTLNKIFHEGGLIINKLYSIPIMNIFSFNCGIGAFYRLGYHTLPEWTENLAVKLSFTFSY